MSSFNSWRIASRFFLPKRVEEKKNFFSFLFTFYIAPRLFSFIYEVTNCSYETSNSFPITREKCLILSDGFYPSDHLSQNRSKSFLDRDSVRVYEALKVVAHKSNVELAAAFQSATLIRNFKLIVFQPPVG